MKAILVSISSALSLVAYAAVGQTLQKHSVNTAHLNETKGTSWARRGQTCGNGSGTGAVCGDGLCCSIHHGTCGSDTSCGTSNCIPSYSTGCHNQGLTTKVNGPSKSNSGTRGPFLDSPVRHMSSKGHEPVMSPKNPGSEKPDSKSSPFPSLDYLAQLPRPDLGLEPYAKVISSCTVPGTLALTFDDGPWHYTSDLLDLLERERVRVTFFVCGNNMADNQLTSYGHPQLLRRMITSGHQIGTHTWAHPNLADLSESETYMQMYLNEQALVGVLGLIPTYFRPPYLEWSAETLNVMAKLGYHVVTIDVDTRDWEGDYDAARQNFLAGLGWGSDSRLVLAHDIHERTVYDFAEWMIDLAKERGYRLVTVGECLGDPVDNWYRSPYTGKPWQPSESSSSSSLTPDAPSAHS